jgi:SlyX protein
MEERLETLESKMMSAEDQIDALNSTVWQQQQDLQLLREQFRQVVQQLRAMQSDMPGASADEIPPHW